MAKTLNAIQINCIAHLDATEMFKLTDHICQLFLKFTF